MAMTLEQKRLKIKKYFKENPLRNAWACHNGERKKLKLETISFKLYLQYRDFSEKDKLGRIKTSIKHNPILIWEEYRKRYQRLNG